MRVRGTFAVAFLINAHIWAGSVYVQESDYAGVGEGWTSTIAGEGIRIAGRMFTAPELAEICDEFEDPAGLAVRETEVELRLGESLALSSLTIHALDRESRALDPIPISMIVENEGANILDLAALREMNVSPLRPGSVRFRVQAICGNESQAEAVISVRVSR
jgi:gamma-glutamylcyclotransferase (GGCT)/AIG2-like uncharacterized protein YtfP